MLRNSRSVYLAIIGALAALTSASIALTAYSPWVANFLAPIPALLALSLISRSTLKRWFTHPLVIWLLSIAILSLAAILGARVIIESNQSHGRLVATDAPIVVTTVVSITAAAGTLIGGILAGLAKLIQARGKSDADLIRAKAELLRAEADVERERRLSGVDGHIAPNFQGRSIARGKPLESED